MSEEAAAPVAARPLLRVERLHKLFRMGESDLHVLKGIDLDVREGEVLAIMGPSGAGKSTLLHLLGMLDRPSRGRILYHNVDLAALAGARAASVRNRCFGFVFQFFHLMPEMTVLENVAMARMIGSSTLGWAARRWGAYGRARRILDRLGMSHRLDSVPSQLSGGERQRVAIARALMNDPEVIFCDEPTGNLDLATATEIQGLLKKLNRELGKTIVIVTHDERIAEGAHRVVRLVDGRVVETQEREPLAPPAVTAGAEPWAAVSGEGARPKGWTQRITLGLFLAAGFLLYLAHVWGSTTLKTWRSGEPPLRLEGLSAALALLAGLGCLLARDLGRRLGFLMAGVAAAWAGMPLLSDACRAAAETWVTSVHAELRFLLSLAWLFLLLGAMVARGRDRGAGWMGLFLFLCVASLGGLVARGAHVVERRPGAGQEWLYVVLPAAGILFFDGLLALFISARRAWLASAILLPLLAATVLASGGYLYLRVGVHGALVSAATSLGGLLCVAILGAPTLRKRLRVG